MTMRLLTKLLEKCKEHLQEMQSKVKGAPSPSKNPEYLHRAPRIRLLSLHGLHFERKVPAFDSKIFITNLSTTGIGFLKESGEPWPEEGSVIEGSLFSQNNHIEIQAKVIHTSTQVVGCHFEGPSKKIEDFVNRFFDLELSALRMNPVNPDILKPENDGTPFWFLGVDNCELYYTVSPNGKVLRFSLSYFGNYLEGGVGRTTKLGHVVEDEGLEKPHYKGSALIRVSPTMESSLTETALRFLTNIEKLPSDHRSQIIEFIEEAA